MALTSLRHLMVIEEPHRLMRNPDGRTGPATHEVECSFTGLLAEVRAYGEGLVIAEQIPSSGPAGGRRNCPPVVLRRPS